MADGKTVWFYVPADHSVTRSAAKESSDWRTPLALLTGKADLSRLCSRNCRFWSASSPGTFPRATRSCVALPKGEKEAAPAAGAASPEDPTALPGATELYGTFCSKSDSSTGELARVQIRQAGGIELEYRFGDWATKDCSVSDEMFHFNPPRGVAIIDDSSVARSSSR